MSTNLTVIYYFERKWKDEVRIISSSEFNGFLRLHIPIVVDNLTGISFGLQTLLGKLPLILKGIDGG